VADVATHVFGIYVAPSKTYRSRYVYLPDEGMAFFLRQRDTRDPTDWLFPNAAGRPWANNYRHLFKDAVRRAGLSDRIVFHSLRHTYASQLVQAGTPTFDHRATAWSRHDGHGEPDLWAPRAEHAGDQRSERGSRRSIPNWCPRRMSVGQTLRHSAGRSRARSRGFWEARLAALELLSRAKSGVAAIGVDTRDGTVPSCRWQRASEAGADVPDHGYDIVVTKMNNLEQTDDPVSRYESIDVLIFLGSNMASSRRHSECHMPLSLRHVSVFLMASRSWPWRPAAPSRRRRATS
jgi:hypothetical protein